MKILNLKINNFGKLSNKEIEFSDGINIIYGNNESGKSTLLKFIMGMFYGLSKNKNGKFIPDYERYIPWDKDEFSGKISYKLDNKEKFEVFRNFKKKNPQIFNEDLEDISSNYNIDKTTGNKFFIEQTGVDEELFSSTIVAFQEEVKLDEKEQSNLVQKMSNLANTGEDNLSFNKIINKLNKKQTEEIGTIRTKDRPLNVISKRMEEIISQKESLNNFRNKQYELDENIEYLQRQLKEQEIKEELLEKIKKVKQTSEIAEEKLKINNNAIQEYNKKIEDIGANAAKQEVKNSAKISNNRFQIIFCIIFVIITIVSLTFIKNDIISSISIVITILTVIYTGYTNYKKKLNSVKQTENTKINTNQNQIEVLKNLKTKLEDETNSLSKKLQEEYRKNLEKIKNEYLGIISVDEIDEVLAKNDIENELLTLQNRINENKIKIHKINFDRSEIQKKLENLVALEEEYALLEEQYNELNENSNLINMVKEEIEKAYGIMKKDIAPTFTNNLSRIISRISNGKYKNVKLDETNGMIIEIENGNYINALNLSTGTIDQLYLSLRLGTGKEISKESMPIILDEVFAYWDNTRLENILEFINNEYEDRQIILFTCTNREKEALEKLNIKYNYICI